MQFRVYKTAFTLKINGITSNQTVYSKYTSINFDVSKRYYLSLDSNYGNWEQNSAWFAVYLYAPLDANVTWVRLTKYGDSHIYYFDVPSGTWNKMVWIRMNPTYTESEMPTYNSNYGFWNQSVDIFKDGDKDYWIMNSNQWGSSGSGATGSWTTKDYDNDGNREHYRLFEPQLSPTPSTMRFWFTFVDGDESSSIFLGGSQPGFMAYEGDAISYYLMTSYYNGPNNTGTRYFYVDVPTSVTHFRILRVQGTSSYAGRFNIYNFQAESEKKSVSSYMPSELWEAKFYFYDKNQYILNCSVTLLSNNTLGTYYVSGLTMSKVLEAYYTCLSSDYNGYGAKNNLKNNFWDHRNADNYNGSFVAASNAGPWVYDYTYSDYVAHGNSYTGCTRSGSYGMNDTAKWTALSNAQSRYGLSVIRIFSPLALFGDSEDGFSTLIIIVASSVALLSVTSLSILVLKKRKRKEQE